MDDREFRVMNLKSKWINAAHNYWNMVPHADNKWRNSANNCQLKPPKLWVAPAMYRLYRASAAMGTCTWNWRFKVKQQNANSNRFSMPCMLYSDPNIQTFHPSLWGTGHPSPWHVPHWHAPRLHPIRKFKPGTRTRQLQMMPYLWVLFSFQHSNAQKKIWKYTSVACALWTFLPMKFAEYQSSGHLLSMLTCDICFEPKKATW